MLIQSKVKVVQIYPLFHLKNTLPSKIIDAFFKIEMFQNVAHTYMTDTYSWQGIVSLI